MLTRYYYNNNKDHEKYTAKLIGKKSEPGPQYSQVSLELLGLLLLESPKS